MQFSLEKLQKAKQADAAILSAWATNNSIKITTTYSSTTISMQPDVVMPFYSNKQNNNPYQTSVGDCLWLFSGKM
jgi:hypothetical protein